jgi:hypothetical protein
LNLSSSGIRVSSAGVADALLSPTDFWDCCSHPEMVEIGF